MSRFKDSQYIYLLILREHVNSNENVFKIGKTKSIKTRFLGYPKGSVVIYYRNCIDCDMCEKNLLKIFKLNFNQRIEFGNEYFEGNDNEMIKIINNFLDKEMFKKSSDNFICKNTELFFTKRKNIYENVLNELMLKIFIELYTVSNLSKNNIITKDTLMKCFNYRKLYHNQTNDDELFSAIYFNDANSKQRLQIYDGCYLSEEQLDKRFKIYKLDNILLDMMVKKYGKPHNYNEIVYWKTSNPVFRENHFTLLSVNSLSSIDYSIKEFIVHNYVKTLNNCDKVYPEDVYNNFRCWFQDRFNKKIYSKSKESKESKELYEDMDYLFGTCTDQGWCGAKYTGKDYTL
jgi:hypothetical protein